MLFGPTNEEMITEIVRAHIRSYKDLPKNLYHIQWKFRDEVRPRFGIMRGREFLMKDAYSFDLTYEDARATYNRMFVAYLRTYARMGLKAIPMAADTGPIGGDLSHEFIILADTGESEVFCHKDLLEIDVLGESVDYDSDLQPVVDRWTNMYAATDEKHDPAESAKLGDDLIKARGIEVGHIFYFGTKYSKAMNASAVGPDGDQVFPEMGSYGIGVSRLVGGLIEAFHDENGIVWPEAVAPFGAGIINLKSGDEACDTVSADLYAKLQAAGCDPIYDDRDVRAGAKFADMDLIGIPWQIVVGPRGVKNGVVEFKNRASGEREEISAESAMARLTA
jgi:prolyl-tRNA synthetase